ncbi:hypothetical protein RDWZM_010388 [Blomia tropicalis]|uniref:Major facilitator superfamily (MFS) profile domain-containing protein n=1 Tax=Blomia tropicalis TaxID=40697 RepID=A0A9Q0RHN1_BLOTA|nr:hypothetical protein RDWZM_010388 [Blomia tropicalis]
MKFEDVLRQVGDEGRFQTLIIILLLLPTSFLNAFYDSIIQMATPDHWCRIPHLGHLSNEIQHQMIRPINNDTKQSSTCHRFDLNYESIKTIDDFHQLTQNYSSLNDIPIVKCTDGYQYDQSLYRETAVTWFDFVCDRDFYTNNIISLSLIGLAILTPIISNLSDRIGRRKTLMIIFLMAALATANPLLTKTLPTFLIARFISGGVLNVFYQIPFVMTQEVVSQKYRTRSSCLSAIFYSLGSCFVPIVAKFTGHWVLFNLFQFLSIVPFILCYSLFPESPFWLISAKRYGEAYKELERIGRVNRKQIPSTLMRDIQSIDAEIDATKVDDTKDKFSDLFLMPGLRMKTFTLALTFIACLIGYGGIAYNTINLEAKNQLYNFFLLSMVDIPALLLFWYLVNTRFGRRWSNVLGLMICGVSLIIPTFTPVKYSIMVNLICTIFGKFGIAGVYMVIYQHASELFPTTLRNQGMGVCATISSLVGIALPQLIYMVIPTINIILFV